MRWAAERWGVVFSLAEGRKRELELSRPSARKEGVEHDCGHESAQFPRAG